MGCQQSKFTSDNKSTLFVATLNYSAIIDCPFQFYCEQHHDQLYHISQIFYKFIKLYVPTFDKDKFKWAVGKIDKKFRTNRYSPLFSVDAGIQKFEFLNREGFQREWDNRFEKSGLTNKECSQQQKNNMRLFDFIFYHAVLSYVYNSEDFQAVIKNDTRAYLNFMQPFFKLSYLNEETKLQKVISSFENMNVDVFFLQEYSQYFMKYLERNTKYTIFCNSTQDNMIVLDKSTFKAIKPIADILSAELIKKLDWNEKTTLAFADDIIMICAHLNSKSDKNSVQLKQMEDSLIQLRRKMPQYDIILGGDLNSFYSKNAQAMKDINIYPSLKNELTTIKKRTMAQVQYEKAEKVVKESKDKLMSTLSIDKSVISFIDMSLPHQNSYIPTDKHPFDHFMISVCLSRGKTDKE